MLSEEVSKSLVPLTPLTLGEGLEEPAFTSLKYWSGVPSECINREERNEMKSDVYHFITL